MGRAKEWMLEQYERGYSQTHGSICADCVNDSYLKSWIVEGATANTCNFCDRSAKSNFAIELDEFVGKVLDGISYDWNDPDNEGIAFESREGGYIADLTHTLEVLYELEISESEAVNDAIAGSLYTEHWVQKEYYRGSDSDLLRFGWDHFKDIVKHQTRNFFQTPEKDNGWSSEEIAPSQMLERISSIVRQRYEGSGLFRTIGMDVDLHRLRIDKETHKVAEQIGTPKPEHARQSNRMSPAGVPMFYGAFEYEVAHAESFDPECHKAHNISAGVFRAQRKLRILDLANIPDIPSVFSNPRREWIHSLRFLNEFAYDISKPIKRDGREHIEYVPTQIVTEYFRRTFNLSDGEKLDGIIYRSSKGENADAFVLFCENEQCIDDTPNPFYEPLVKLVSVSHSAA